MRKSTGAGLLLGAAALAGALLLFVTVFAQAILKSPATAVPVLAPTAIPSAPGENPAVSADERSADVDDPSDRSATEEVLRLAVERATFAPDRRAPSDRYRMPGERNVVAEVLPAPPELPPAPDSQLLGTVTGADGGVTVVQIEVERPHLMAMGQELFGYRIASIGRGRVTMEGPGKTVNLAVAAPMPTGSVASNERSDRGQQEERGRDNEQQVRLFQAALEQARTMQERTGSPYEVQMRDGRFVIQGPAGEVRVLRPDGVQVRVEVTISRTVFPPQERPPPAMNCVTDRHARAGSMPVPDAYPVA